MVILDKESKKLSKRIDRTYTHESENGNPVRYAPGLRRPGLTRERSLSHSDLLEFKEERSLKHSLKKVMVEKDPSKTMPSSPCEMTKLPKKPYLAQKKMALNASIAESRSGEVKLEITDKECIFPGGLMLDPKRLFGRDEESTSSIEVRKPFLIHEAGPQSHG